MGGWSRIVAGAVLGVVGTVYATNEEFRKQLPKSARDLPVTVRRRFSEAASAAREASSRRREEILRDLEEHGGSHTGRNTAPATAKPAAASGTSVPDDATRPLPRMNPEQAS